MSKYPEIEPNIWTAILWATLSIAYQESGMAYELFSEDCMIALNHYRFQWKKE